MRRFCSTFLFLAIFLCPLLKGQDVDHSILEQDFCKPGVRNSSPGKGLWIEYGLQFDDDFFERIRNDEKVRSYEIFRGKLKLPVLLKERHKMLLGFSYLVDEYAFSYSDGLNETPSSSFLESSETLKSAGISLLSVYSLSRSNYFVFRGSVSSDGDYAQFMNFDPRYLSYKFGGMLGFKQNEDMEWGVGVAMSTGFRGTNVIPLLMYNRTFNKQWGIEAVLPASLYLRRNIGPGELVRIGADINTKNYALSVEDQHGLPADFNMNRWELHGQVNYEKQLSGWLWMSARAGYIHGLRNRFEAPNDRNDFFNVQAQSGLFGKLGVFLSPPKDCH